MARATRTGGREATKGVIPGRYALSVGHPNLPEPEGFRWIALDSVARLESGHTPSRSRDEYWGGDVPWIGIRDATGNHGRVISETLDYVTEAGLENSSARLLPAGTVCLSRTASVGYVVEMGIPMATSQDFVNWVCGPELNARYLRYVLMLEQESIRRFAHGTTHQTMYYPEAKALHALLPNRPMQDAIAEILGALDDKIAANDRLFALSDQLAEAITLNTFDGSAVSLAEVAEITMGSSPPGTSYNEDGTGTAFYQGVRDFGVRVPTRRVWTTQPVRLAEAKDTLLSVRAPVGRTNLANETLCLGRGVAGLRSRSGAPMTLFHQVRAAKAAWAPYEAEGTVFGAINRTQLEIIRLPGIQSERIDVLESELIAVEDRVAATLCESGALARTRDELLPLLMSGKVRVKDAEKVVEEVL